MRYLMIGTAALALAACTNTTAVNETAAIDNASDSVVLADNGAVATPGNAMALPASGGARATLAMADGADVGSAVASAAANGLTFTVDARNMPAGTYAVHVHTTGKCEGPKFESAGGHWNPLGKQHGRDNPQGAHYGDLPNLTISSGGTGSVSFTVPGAAMNGLLDADGAAFMIHAKPDDYKTDPTGNAGDRIACGVFARG
jgi:superoxide dismutase, Cu-Zn family